MTLSPAAVLRQECKLTILDLFRRSRSACCRPAMQSVIARLTTSTLSIRIPRGAQPGSEFRIEHDRAEVALEHPLEQSGCDPRIGTEAQPAPLQHLLHERQVQGGREDDRDLDDHE